MSVASALLPEISSADTQQLPKVYVIAEIEVVDASTYEGYTSAAAPIAAQYGGDTSSGVERYILLKAMPQAAERWC